MKLYIKVCDKALADTASTHSSLALHKCCYIQYEQESCIGKINANVRGVGFLVVNFKMYDNYSFNATSCLSLFS